MVRSLTYTCVTWPQRVNEQFCLLFLGTTQNTKICKSTKRIRFEPVRDAVKCSYSKSCHHKLMTCLTHWGHDIMDAISQTTFSSAFSWMKMFEFRLKYHWNLFLRVQLTIFQHWFRQWLGTDQVTSHYLNQWWLLYQRIYASLGLDKLRNDLCCCVSGKYGMLITDMTTYNEIRVYIHVHRYHGDCNKLITGFPWNICRNFIT